jgi:hypothetical protein
LRNSLTSTLNSLFLKGFAVSKSPLITASKNLAPAPSISVPMPPRCPYTITFIRYSSILA